MVRMIHLQVYIFAVVMKWFWEAKPEREAAGQFEVGGHPPVSVLPGEFQQVVSSQIDR